MHKIENFGGTNPANKIGSYNCAFKKETETSPAKDIQAQEILG